MFNGRLEINLRTMGNQKSKVKILQLPAQSGKTRKVEEEIVKFNRERFEALNEVCGAENDINIWISANNKLLVDQTKRRLTKDLSEDVKGDIFSWTSGTKESNISAKELAFDILSGDIEIIVLCSHPKRVEYLVDMLTRLNQLKTPLKRNINIWIDEADHSVNLWSQYEEVLDMPFLKQVTLVSATFDSVIKRHGQLNIIRYKDTHPACYRCMKDSTIIEENGSYSTSGYVEAVLKKYQEKLVRPGMRAFIPGNNTQRSHEEISSILIAYGFVVIILNGAHKEMRFPDRDAIDLSPYLTVSESALTEFNTEFNTVISQMYVDLDICKYPLAITGFICVERGITFQCAPLGRSTKLKKAMIHNGFLFDYGIIPPMDDKSEAYQTMARLFGNVGEFPEYKPCEIYSDGATLKKVYKQEQIAINLARMAYEEDWEEVTIGRIKAAEKYEEEKGWTHVIKEFYTLQDANAFLKENESNQNNAEVCDGTGRFPEDIGFYQTSTTGYKRKRQYDELMLEINRWSKLSNFDIGNKNKYCRLYICYKDFKDKTSSVFVIRMITRI